MTHDVPAGSGQTMVVSRHGRITLTPFVRKYLAVAPGDQLFLRVEGGSIIVSRVDAAEIS